MQYSKGRLISKEDYNSSLESLEDVFGEELFASLINQDGEIQVGEKIYKYIDVGLFIVHREEISNLYAYLDKQGISKNFVVEETPTSIKEQYIKSARSLENFKDSGSEELRILDPCEEVLRPVIDKDAGLYRAEYFLADLCGGGGTSGVVSNDLASADEINNALKNISPCEVKKPFLSNLFESVKNCYDQYDSKHRVKIKYFDSDYLLAYHVGVKVKHQKKGWTGLWRKQNADQMAVGINSVWWVYTPPILQQNYSGFPTNYYVNNGKLYSSLSGYTNAVYQGKGNIPLPEIPFVRDADVIVEIVTNDFGFLDTEREVREFVYKNIFDTAKNLLKSESNKQMKDLVTIVTTNKQMWIQYYDFNSQCRNCEKYEKTFDWGVVTPKTNYSFGAGNDFGGGSWNFTGFDFDFKRPKSVGINMFGLVKKSGKWHGSRMVIE